MQYSTYLLPLAISLCGALLCIIRGAYFEKIVSIVAASGVLIATVSNLWKADNISGFFYVDGLSKILMLTIALIYLTTVLYSTAYLKHIKNPLFQSRLYYILLNIFAAAMFFSVIADNLGLIWVGIEATTVTSALLVATENDQVTIESAWRYVIIVSTGLVISLISTTFIFGASGTLSLHVLLQHHPTNRVFLIGLLLGLIGFGTKAGIFPMHTWPDVHGKAPSPVSAIFSGVLLPVALYAMARLIQVSALPAVRIFSLVLGILTVIVAALMMTVQTNYKRMFAYSSMENMGMILVGFALGGSGVIGAAIVILAHGLAKSGVFFLTGDVLSTYHSTDIADIHSLFKRMPRSAFGLFLGSMAVTGAPPFAIFAGELFILAQLIQSYGWLLAVVLILFLAIAFIAVNYRTGKMIFTGTHGGIAEQHRWETWIPLINLSLSVLVLFMIPYFEQLLKPFFKP